MTRQELQHLRKILTVLAKYGFGDIIGQLKLPLVSFFWSFKKKPKSTESSSKRAINFRSALEELGPTFIKFGQALSMRGEIFPKAWLAELKKLQDAVPPDSFADIKEVVEAETGKTLAEAFKSFNETPVASASIAQVHFAVLQDGTEVAVKVRRPNVVEKMNQDRDLLLTVARLVEDAFPNTKRISPVKVVETFNKTVDKELDFQQELLNGQVLKHNFKDSDLMHVPTFYEDHCTAAILVIERIEGLALSDDASLGKLTEENRIKLSKDAIRIFFKQVFTDGYFHADMHPGNIFIRNENQFAVVDFGIMGHLDLKTRQSLAELLATILKQDYHRCAWVHRQAGLIDAHVDLDDFAAALEAIATPIFSKPLESISIGHLLGQLFKTTQRFDMQVQPKLILLQKTLVMLEALGRQFNPRLNVWEVAEPLAAEWIMQQKGIEGTFSELKQKGEMLASYLGELPLLSHALAEQLPKGQFTINVQPKEIWPLTQSIHGAGKSVFHGLVSLSLIGSAALFWTNDDSFMAFLFWGIGLFHFGGIQLLGKLRQKKL